MNTYTAKERINMMNEPKEYMIGDIFACQINFINPENNKEDETSFDIDCSKSNWKDTLLSLWEDFRKENNLPENCVTDAWSTLSDK